MPESKRHSTGTAKKITKKKTASISLTESPVQSQAAFGGGAQERASLEPACAPWRGERAFARVRRGQRRMTMLQIQVFALETVRSLAPVVREIAAQDPDLGRQLRRAASSIVLNIAEGAGPRNGNSRLRFRTAFGSTRETRAALELAAAFGYVERDEQVLDALDRIAATLFRLAE